jgi:hypothetical protein
MVYQYSWPMLTRSLTRSRSHQTLRQIWIGVLLITLSLSSFTGCRQPILAPVTQYDAAAAELLRKELGKMDWQ